MLVIQLSKGRHLNIAPSLHRTTTARMKGTSAWSLERAGNRTFNRNQTLPRGLAEARHSSQEIHSVRVLGVAEDLAHRSILHHLPQIHDGDRIRDLRDHTQI